MSRKFFSVCIPAYNRPEYLPPLLDSIFTQDCDDYEIVICEDKSPKRTEIAEIVKQYNAKYPGKIHYFENEKNLGYDGNFRNLIEKSTGEYCLFMGNDDLMAPKALSVIKKGIDSHENVGIVMRAYSSFDTTPDKVNQVFRYFPQDAFFAAGDDTIVTFFRRLVVIPGITIHRDSALAVATDEFDGTLLYQLHLVANILCHKNGLYLNDIVVFYRNGGVPEFGNSESEKGKFVPGVRTPDSSVEFMKGMFRISKRFEEKTGRKVNDRIIQDVANYSYPILSVQARQRFSVFFKYYRDLAKIGFGKNKMFHLYFFALTFLGVEGGDSMIRWIKNQLGYTPVIGSISRGSSK